MSILKSFLESSTIHGLVHIANNRSFARLFWMMIVLTGFSIAGILIRSSFVNWADSPVKTTIKTRPIWDLQFPKITVCPPDNSFTNLNYDLMTMDERVNLTKKERIDIGDHAFNILQDSLHQKVIDDFFKVEEENRYQNLYYGKTSLIFPQNSLGFKLFMKTFATSGSIKTKYFGELFNSANVEKDFHFTVDIIAPDQAIENKDVTLHIEIEKVSMQVSGDSVDKIWVKKDKSEFDPKANHVVYKITGPSSATRVEFKRFVTKEDVKNNEKLLPSMPGFNVKWFFDPKIEMDLDKTDGINKEFRR